jgi:hypothetical protein
MLYRVLRWIHLYAKLVNIQHMLLCVRALGEVVLVLPVPCGWTMDSINLCRNRNQGGNRYDQERQTTMYSTQFLVMP